MSKLIDAAQKALEALKKSHPYSNSDRDLDKHSEAIHALRAALAEQPAEQEPVAAQHRFRHPQKGTPDWSVWQPCKVAQRPAWEIDSQGYEVEYRALYTAPQPAKPAEQEPCGWQFFQDGQWYNGSDRHDHRKHTEAAGFPTRDVYPAPQPAKREPLTDEEIGQVTDTQWASNNHKPIYAAHRAYARAIERAHGIGGPP